MQYKKCHNHSKTWVGGMTCFCDLDMFLWDSPRHIILQHDSRASSSSSFLLCQYSSSIHLSPLQSSQTQKGQRWWEIHCASDGSFTWAREDMRLHVCPFSRVSKFNPRPLIHACLCEHRKGHRSYDLCLLLPAGLNHTSCHLLIWRRELKTLSC